MYRLTLEETELLITISELFAENHDDAKMSMKITNIVDKLKIYNDFRLESRVTPAKKQRCINLMKEASRIIEEYAQYAGDMGLINEYDRLKKESGVILNSVGDAEGQLRADQESAKRELDVILDRVKEDLLENEEAKSNAEAERKAKVDPRFMIALEEYRDCIAVGNVMKNKFKVLDGVSDNIRQSVSSARTSIVKEGYTQ